MKQTWKGGAMLSPTPAALVSCGTMEKPNVLTIGWTGIINTVPPKTYISVRPTRYSHKLIEESGEFVINITTTELLKATDYCGVHTGKNKDKFKNCGLTPEESEFVSCPAIKESPLSLECKVFNKVSLGSHDMFMADILAVRVDEKLIDENGRLALEKCNVLAYSHGNYYELKKPLEKIGFAVKKKHKKGQIVNKDVSNKQSSSRKNIKLNK